MKVLIWLGMQMVATLFIWGLALGTELVVETGLHLPAGLTLTPRPGTQNFTAIIVASVLTVVFGIFSALYVTTEMKVTKG